METFAVNGMNLSVEPRTDGQACERCRINHSNGHTLIDWDAETLVYLCDPCLVPYCDTYLWSGGASKRWRLEHRAHNQSNGEE